MDLTPSGSTSHPLGEKISRHDSARHAQRQRARTDRRIRRARTAFTIIFLVGAVIGSLLLFAKGCQRDEPQGGSTATEGG